MHHIVFRWSESVLVIATVATHTGITVAIAWPLSRETATWAKARSSWAKARPAWTTTKMVVCSWLWRLSRVLLAELAGDS